MSGDARPAARVGAFELLGDPDAQACEGGLCALPAPPEPDEEPAPAGDEPS